MDRESVAVDEDQSVEWVMGTISEPCLSLAQPISVSGLIEPLEQGGQEGLQGDSSGQQSTVTAASVNDPNQVVQHSQQPQADDGNQRRNTTPTRRARRRYSARSSEPIVFAVPPAPRQLRRGGLRRTEIYSGAAPHIVSHSVEEQHNLLEQLRLTPRTPPRGGPRVPNILRHKIRGKK